MGTYLLIIASKDVHYRGNYNKYALSWTSSWECQLTGMLAMLSMEVSILILACISVERYLIITHPFRMCKIERTHAYMTLAAVWIFSILLCILPIVTIHPRNAFYGSNGVCFPLHIHRPYEPGWQWSAFVFFGLNVVAIMIIVVCYTAMFLSIRGSRVWGQGSQANDAIVARRFFVIITAGVLCSLPIIIFKVSAYAGVKLPGKKPKTGCNRDLISCCR